MASIDKDEKQAIAEQIEEKLTELSAKRGCVVFPFLQGDNSVDHDMVDDVFDNLSAKVAAAKNPRLDVVINSSGGDIHAAYNLSLLFRRFGCQELNFIVPRWAKSAATLIVCAGNRILMGPIAELGPLDPQITEMNPLEGRLEHFSPLHIKATLKLIRDEFKNGEEKLANGLLQRLQFPLTLGGYQSSLDIGKDYLKRLLRSRMFSGDDASEQAERVAKALVEEYADHGFCIDIDEARKIGLVVDELPPDIAALVWDVHRLGKQREKLEQKEKQKQLEDALKELPPDLLRVPSSPSTPPSKDSSDLRERV